MSGAGGDWTLCVDFGTAYSKAAAAPVGAWTRFDPATVRPLPLGAHEQGGNPLLLESAVFVDDDRILFGRAAMARAADYASTKRQALRSFKTMLSVSDLDRALNTNAPASVDPHRVFQMRDLIVLYLAYLVASVERAAGADAMLADVAEFERRYAAPAWRSGDSAHMHDMIVRLFGEAEAFRQSVGDSAILNPRGVTLKAVSNALPAAIAAPRMQPMGLIFEATAAAAYTSIGIADSGSHLIVVDMGAGTTDIAALARTGSRIAELPQARMTLKQAGDFVDRVIANIALDLSAARSPEQKAELWRALMQHMRDIKESLFFDGRASLRSQGRALMIGLKDVEKDRDYRGFVKALEEAYFHAFAALYEDARARGRTEIQAIAVGGGASTPALQQLIRSKPRGAGKVRVAPRPATPDWAHAREFRGNLAPVFPQLAIAIGGALAPESMLAARSGVSRAANDRNGIPAERD